MFLILPYLQFTSTYIKIKVYCTGRLYYILFLDQLLICQVQIVEKLRVVRVHTPGSSDVLITSTCILCILNFGRYNVEVMVCYRF